MALSVCPVVLATAPGKGFADSRWLARWGKTTLLEHVLGQVRGWGFDDGILVLGDDAELIIDRIDLSGFAVILDPEWKEGPAASLRTAFDFLQREGETEAALVVDAAYSNRNADVARALVAAAETTERPAIVPKYRYALGEPVLLRRWVWPQLVGVDRSASLGSVLETHRDWVHEVWVDRVPPPQIDTPEALEGLAPRR